MKALYGEALERRVIKEQCKKGKRIGEVILGEEWLIHRYFFLTSYIAYSDIRRAYMRVAGGEFGEFPVDEYSLVLEDLDGNEHVLHLDRPEYGKKCLEWLEKVQSSIKIGKMKQYKYHISIKNKRYADRWSSKENRKKGFSYIS